jgi:hypothetical protein
LANATAVVLGQVLPHPGGAELGVLVGDHLGEAGGGADDDAGVAVQRAVGLAAPGALVDVPFNGGDAVGGLVLLADLPHGGELERPEVDRGAVGVEPRQRLLGGGDAGPVEGLLDGLLGVEHRVLVGDLDLEDEAGVGAADDGGHGGGLRGAGSGCGGTHTIIAKIRGFHMNRRPHPPRGGRLDCGWKIS